MTQKMKTQTIAGYDFTLQTGEQYLAYRPMARRGIKTFPVTIKNMNDGLIATRINGLSYGEANELINAFNNEEVSFRGRKW